MGISVSILLIAVGAILTWGVTAEAEGLDVTAVGVILLIVGLLGLVISMIFWSSWGGFGRGTTSRAARFAASAGRDAARRPWSKRTTSLPVRRLRNALAPAKQRTSQIAGHVAGDLRVLLQPPEGVLVPLAAIGHVDPKPMAVGDDSIAQLGAHAQQHLELVAILLEAPFAQEAERLLDEPLVMCRDRGVAIAVQERLERLDEAGSHRLVVLELDRLGLDVDPLAKPDARPGERGGIRDRSLERRLEDRADAAVTLVAQLAEEPQRLVGRGRVLHVDPHEAVRRLGGRDHRLDVALAELVAELQAEPGRLDADVRVEVVPLEGVERRNVLCGDRRGLGLVGDLLAQDVDGRELAVRVEFRDDAACVLELGARDVPRRELLARPASGRPGAA